MKRFYFFQYFKKIFKFNAFFEAKITLNSDLINYILFFPLKIRKTYLLKMFSSLKKIDFGYFWKLQKKISNISSLSSEKPMVIVRPIIFSKDDISMRVRPLKVQLI